MAGLAVQLPTDIQNACEQVDSKRSRQQQLVCDELDKLGEPPFDFAIEQVKVSIALAHAGYGNQMLKPIHSQDTLRPLIMIGASGDTSTPMSQEATPLFKAHTGPVAMVTIKGGSHYSFANICEVEKILPDTTQSEVGDICSDTATPTIEESFQIINAYTLAALELFVRGNQQARSQFAPLDAELMRLQSKGIFTAGDKP
ncbi:MAG TPA: hypothetical protein DCQ06_01030 [Myxococcales bacterium]|nr:hypothetical protein [Myxococcales bacterium]